MDDKASAKGMDEAAYIGVMTLAGAVGLVLAELKVSGSIEEERVVRMLLSLEKTLEQQIPAGHTMHRSVIKTVLSALEELKKGPSDAR